jgi:hypothetical protein
MPAPANLSSLFRGDFDVSQAAVTNAVRIVLAPQAGNSDHARTFGSDSFRSYALHEFGNI